MSRAWIITEDLIESSTDSAVNTTGPRDARDEDIAALKAGAGFAFVMKDDDGIPYYKGRAMWDEDDVEEGAYGPLGDFGGPNAGCVSITYPDHHEFDCG